MSASFNKNGVISGSPIEGYDKASIYRDDIVQNPNLMVNTSNPSYGTSNMTTCTWRNAGATTSGTVKSLVASADAPVGKNVIQINVTTTAGDNTVGIDGYKSIISGKTYTFSCYVKGTGLAQFLTSAVSDYGYEYFKKYQMTDSSWEYLSWTFAAQSSSPSIYVRNYGLGTMQFCGFKLEEGSVSTPWCPNSADGYGTIEPQILSFPIKVNDIIEY